MIVEGSGGRSGTAGRSSTWEGDLQFRRLLEKLPAGAYTCDAEGLITYFNQQAVQLWGRAPKLNDPVDRFCGSFKLFALDGSPIAHDRCWMALALQMNKEFNRREIIVERPDGERLTALAHANPICDGSGRLLGAVNVLVDISDRKRAENALQEVREYERRRIARDLHDLVLQDLAYAAQTLDIAKLDAGSPGLEREMQEGIDTIRRAAVELRSIVFDLHIGDEVERPFLDMVEDLVIRNQRMAVGQGIRLEVAEDFPSSPLGKSGFELLRIIQEALTNARRHSGAGAITVYLDAHDDLLVVEVGDDGRGFTEDTVHQGVGLTSMQERAIAIGGSLEVESSSGSGTKVRFSRRLSELS